MMKDEVLRRIRQYGLVQRGDNVFCALSGGADSVAMTHLLWSLKDALGIRLNACHLNHRLRGAQSDGDEAFCREWCRSLGIPLVCGQADVKKRMRETGESLEEAARNCRYAFFGELDGIVATAHTADDNAETVLLALVRGTGLKGLCGIPPKRGRVIRPLIGCTRQDVLRYLEEKRLPHREDGSNALDDCLRNRLRHRVLPLLTAENPKFLQNTAELTAFLREDEDLLRADAEELLLRAAAGEDRYRVAVLAAAPAPLRRRALRTILTALGVKKLSRTHLEAAESLLLSDRSSASADLPGGLRAVLEYDVLRFSASDAPTTFSPAAAAAGCCLTLSDGDRFALKKASVGLRLRPDALTGEVTVRPRAEGDTILLSGGHRSVKKFLIDRRVPKSERERLPLLVREKTVLAVADLAVNADFAARGGEEGFAVVWEKQKSPD